MLSGVLSRVRSLALLKHAAGPTSLSPALASLPPPWPTVRASEVPALFCEPYILSGYRPAGQPWRCYVRSLFQRHNESLNVWTHLLAVPLLLLRFAFLATSSGLGVDFSSSSPLFLYVLSALTYLSFSSAAHLLQSHSELVHYSLFFLDYVGVAVYQYGSALAHYFYCADEAWRRSPQGTLFLPAAALLSWLSCASCCFAKSRYRRPYPLRRKLFQLVPTGLAYLLDVGPVAQRLASWRWEEPELRLHALHVAFFLLAAFFFSCPVPERLFPGRCDVVGHSHQIFHIFLALCTLCQMEAVFGDFLRQRREAAEGHVEGRVAMASFLVLVMCSALTAALMRKGVKRQLEEEDEEDEEERRKNQ